MTGLRLPKRDYGPALPVVWAAVLLAAAVMGMATRAGQRAATPATPTRAPAPALAPRPMETALSASKYRVPWLAEGKVDVFWLEDTAAVAEAQSGLKYTNLPAFRSDQPLFGFIEISNASWVQEQVKGKSGAKAGAQVPRVLRYPVALDEPGGSGSGYATMHVDCDGDGSFSTGLATVQGYLEFSSSGYHTLFPPVDLRVAATLFARPEQAPTAEAWVHFNATPGDRGKAVMLGVFRGTLGRGRLIPGEGTAIRVVLADLTSDGDYLDRGVDLMVIGDRMLPLSKLILWEGSLWDVQVTPQALRLSPYAGQTVRIAARALDGYGRPFSAVGPVKLTALTSRGPNEDVVLSCYPDDLLLPPGSYTADYAINLGAVTRSGRPGAGGLGLSAVLKVPSTAEGPWGLVLGGPVRLALTMGDQAVRGKSVRIGVQPQTESGHRVVAAWNPSGEPFTLEVPEAPAAGRGKPTTRRVGIGFG